MNTKRVLIGSLLLLVLFLVTSCAPVGMSGEKYGLIYGVFHGFIAPFTWIAKLLGAHVGVYALNNTGPLYWVGFGLGLFALLGGGGGGYARRRGRW